MTDKDIDEGSDLAQELAECKALCAEYLDGWQRSKADYANFKRETKERETELTDRLKARLVEELVPVLESMDKAKVWIKDLGPIESQLEKVLSDFGLEVLGELGEAFDPSRHESVELVPVAEKSQDNIITEVMSRGYALAGRIVTPAKVKVGSYNEKD